MPDQNMRGLNVNKQRYKQVSLTFYSCPHISTYSKDQGKLKIKILHLQNRRKIVYIDVKKEKIVQAIALPFSNIK